MNFMGAIGFAYCIIFLVVSGKRPKIALLLTFASAPFQNDLSGDLPVRFSLAEINLVLSVLVFLHSNAGRRLKFGPLLPSILLYFAVCLVSSLRDWRDTTTISILQSALYLILAVFLFANMGETIADFLLPMYGLMTVGVFVGFLSLFSATAFLDLGLNKNGIGGSLSCALLVATETWLSAKAKKQKWLWLCVMALIAVGLIVTLSRGSWLGAIAGLVVLFGIKGQVKSLIQTMAVLVPVVAICWTQLPEDSKDFAVGFDTKRDNISARLESIDTAERYFEREPILGVGVGLRKEFDATNIVMTLLAETGVFGLVTFLGIHFSFFTMVWNARKRVDVASPACSILGIGGALLTQQLVHGLVDHYWSRGSLMMAWAGVGMATRIYFNLKEGVDSGAPAPPLMRSNRVRPPRLARPMQISGPRLAGAPPRMPSRRRYGPGSERFGGLDSEAR